MTYGRYGNKRGSRKVGIYAGNDKKVVCGRKIENATQDKKGSPWHIPKNAKCPRRIKCNEH